MGISFKKISFAFFKKVGLVGHGDTCLYSQQERQIDLCGFKASLVYIILFLRFVVVVVVVLWGGVVSACLVHVCSWRPDEGMRSPGTGVTDKL